MLRRAVHIVPTERQVDALLADGRFAVTRGAFLARMTSRLPLRTAGSDVTRLATAMALEEIRGDGAADEAYVLARALDDALGALRSAGIDAATLRRSSTPRGDLYARLLERTDERLAANGVFDERQVGWLAAKAIDAAGADELPDSAVVDGFFRFDPADLAWIESLAQRTNVTVRMPRTAPDAVLSTLEGRWQSLPKSPELELFELGVPERVTLIEARTDAAEARAIAAAVARALSDGVPAEGVAVVLPDLDEAFLEPLRAALAEARIAFREPRGRAPESVPTVQAALAWLELAAGPLRRDVLIDLLRTRAVDPSPFVLGGGHSFRRHRALALAARLAKTPVRTDRDGKLLIEVLAAEMPRDSDDEWMLESLERISSARADLAKSATRSELVAKLVQIWRAMGLVDASGRAVSELARAEPRSRDADFVAVEVRDHAAGFGALLDAAECVEDAARALGVAHVQIPVARFRTELEQALAGVHRRGTARPGAVRIARAADVAGVSTNFLIIARASEDTFDSASVGLSVLDERLLDVVPAFRRPPSSVELGASARMAVWAALDATERCLVTRAETDASGRPRAPAAMFAELSTGREVGREPASRVHPQASILSARGAELIRLASGAPPDEREIGRRVAVENERLAFFLDPRKPAGPVTGAIEPDDAMRQLLVASFGGTKERPIAATAVERAAQCQFSAFARRVLGASSTDTLGEGLEPWQRGSLVHRALLIALETVRKHAGETDRDVLVAAANAAVHKVLLKDKSAPLYRAEVERSLRDVAAVVEWSLDDGDFRFAYGERSFGEDKPRASRGGDIAWPALAIGTSPRIFVKGRIDRVDVSRDGSRARVIDYKTGALPAWKDVGAVLFQPPLYALAVLLQMGRLSAPEVRALYLDTSKRPPHPLPAEKSQVFSPEMMRIAEQRAAKIVLRLWEGDVAPRPSDAAICGRCDVRDICRRPAAMPVEELELDAEGAGT